jgi:hypothetical protein
MTNRNVETNQLVLCSERTAYSEIIRAKPIEQVQVGDTVLTHLGRFKPVSTVTQTTPAGRIVIINPRFTVPLTLGPHQLVLTMKVNWDETDTMRYREEWVSAGRLSKGDMIALPRVRALARSLSEWNQRRFKLGLSEHLRVAHVGPFHPHLRAKPKNLILSPGLLRLSGYYLAEGCALHPTRTDREVMFTFSRAENIYIEDCRALLGSVFGGKPWVRVHHSVANIFLASVPAYTFFSRYFGRVGPEKRIPRWVLRLPPQHLRELVEGFFRGDGTSDGTTFVMDTAYRDLAHGMALVCGRLGFLTSVRNYQQKEGTINGRVIRSGRLYKLIISGKQRFRFANSIGEIAAPSASGHTGQHFTKRFKKFWVPIDSVTTSLGIGSVHNLGVQGDESFTVSGIAVRSLTVPDT